MLMILSVSVVRWRKECNVLKRRVVPTTCFVNLFHVEAVKFLLRRRFCSTLISSLRHSTLPSHVPCSCMLLYGRSSSYVTWRSDRHWRWRRRGFRYWALAVCNQLQLLIWTRHWQPMSYQVLPAFTTAEHIHTRTRCSPSLGGVMVKTLDLWLAVAGSNPGHDTAWLFLR